MRRGIKPRRRKLQALTVSALKALSCQIPPEIKRFTLYGKYPYFIIRSGSYEGEVAWKYGWNWILVVERGEGRAGGKVGDVRCGAALGNCARLRKFALTINDLRFSGN